MQIYMIDACMSIDTLLISSCTQMLQGHAICNMFAHIHIHICIHMYIHIHEFLYIYTHIYVNIYVHTHRRKYEYMHICRYIWIYTLIQSSSQEARRAERNKQIMSAQ